MESWFGEACGNRFLVVYADDPRAGMVRVRKLRYASARFDSVLYVSAPTAGRSVVRIFEQDGSESAMCGNGMRVVAELFRKSGRKQEAVMGSSFPVERCANGIYSVPVGRIRNGGRYAPFGHRSFFGRTVFSFYRVAGEPHAVALVPDVRLTPLFAWGRRIVPYANCTIVSVRSGALEARTFERGVNRETRSCGTGACAAAYAAIEHGWYKRRAVPVYMNGYRMEVIAESNGYRLNGTAFAQRLSCG